MLGSRASPLLKQAQDIQAIPGGGPQMRINSLLAYRSEMYPYPIVDDWTILHFLSHPFESLSTPRKESTSWLTTCTPAFSNPCFPP